MSSGVVWAEATGQGTEYCCTLTVTDKYIARSSVWRNRVLHGALRRHEPDAGKLACPVLGGGRRGNTSPLLGNLNRNTGILYLNGSRVTNTFDAAGQQTTQQDDTGITSYIYDNDSRRTGIIYPTGAGFSYAYDAVGNRTAITGDTDYGYDAQNRVTLIVNSLNERTTITYDVLDRELLKTLANGIRVSHTYDPAGRETVLENRKADGTALAVFTNTYDAVGNRLTVQELDGVRVTFGYDASYQLINEQRSGANAYNTTYTYDLRRESRMKDCRTLLIRSDSTCRPIGSTLRGRAARQRAV